MNAHVLVSWRATIWRIRTTHRFVSAPLIALALYLIVLLVRWPAIVTADYFNADVASGPVIAQSLATAPSHTEVLLGNYPWFEALGLMSILRGLPDSRFLWEATPFALAFMAVGLVAWGTCRAAGRRAATLTLVIGLAAAPATVADLGTWTVHGLTWVHAALISALAIWLAESRTRWAALGAATLVGLLSGPALASDLLLIPAGLLPLWMTALALHLRGRDARQQTYDRTQLAGTIVATALTALGAVITVIVAHHENIRAAGSLVIHATNLDRLPHNIRVLGEALAALGNGDIFNVALGGSTLIHAVCAALAIIAIVVSLRTAWSALVTPSSAVGVAHAAFWTTALIALPLAFVLTNVPIAAFSGRYLVGVLLAVAALVPLTTGRPLVRVVTSGAVTLFAFTGVMSLVRGEMTADSSRFPTPAEAKALTRFVSAQRAVVGYAGYWDAAPLTWATHFAIHVYPVSPCQDSLCAFEFHRVASWYRPGSTTRSYVVLDEAVREIALRSLPPALGRPVASAHIGQLTAYVFDHDIADDFGRPLSGPQP